MPSSDVYIYIAHRGTETWDLQGIVYTRGGRGGEDSWFAFDHYPKCRQISTCMPMQTVYAYGTQITSWLDGERKKPASLPPPPPLRYGRTLLNDNMHIFLSRTPKIISQAGASCVSRLPERLGGLAFFIQLLCGEHYFGNKREFFSWQNIQIVLKHPKFNTAFFIRKWLVCYIHLSHCKLTGKTWWDMDCELYTFFPNVILANHWK